MELEVGMYVKYTRGAINGYVPPRIAKITDCSDKDLIKIDNGQVILKADILKASYNIIDLIEVGDYVNGERIQYITNKKQLLTDGGYDVLDKYKSIQTILTKEQFENNVYRFLTYNTFYCIR